MAKFNLPYLPCTCKQSRILTVQVSQSALQSQFTEQFFSTSRFTGTKNGGSQRHKDELAPPLQKANRMSAEILRVSQCPFDESDVFLFVYLHVFRYLVIKMLPLS